MVTANVSEPYWTSGHSPMINLPMASFYYSTTCHSDAIVMISRDVTRGSIRYAVLSAPLSSANTASYRAVGADLTYERDIYRSYVYRASPVLG